MVTLLAAAPPSHVDHTGHLVTAVALMTVTLLVVAGVEHGRQLATRLRARRSVHALRLVAGAGAASAGIHLAVVPSHWAAAEVYGVFFLVAGACQLAYSVLVLIRPLRALVAVNLAGNLGLVLLWLQTRTAGIPLGPDAGVREPVGVLDLASVACELVVVLAGARLLLRRPSAGGRSRHPQAVGVGKASVVTAAARP